MTERLIPPTTAFGSTLRYGFARRILRRTVSECSARGTLVIGRRLPAQVRQSRLEPPSVAHFQSRKLRFRPKVCPRPAARYRPPQAFAVFGTASALQGLCRAAPALGEPTREVGPLTYSGRAVALPLTRTPMAGCSCRVGGPTFFSFQRSEESGESHFPGRPLTVPRSLR